MNEVSGSETELNGMKELNEGVFVRVRMLIEMLLIESIGVYEVREVSEGLFVVVVKKLACFSYVSERSSNRIEKCRVG